MRAGYAREALYFDPKYGQFVDITYPKHKEGVFEAALYGDANTFRANQPIRIERFEAKVSDAGDVMRVQPSYREWVMIHDENLLSVGEEIFNQTVDPRYDVQDVVCVPQNNEKQAKKGLAYYQPTDRTLNYVGRYDGPTNWIVTWTPWRGYKERTERIYRLTMPGGKVVYRVTYRPADPTSTAPTITAQVTGFQEEMELPDVGDSLDRYYRTGTVEGHEVLLRESRTYATERDRGITGAQIGWKVIDSKAPKRFRSPRPIRIEDETKPKGFKYILLYTTRKGDPMVELEGFDETHIEGE